MSSLSQLTEKAIPITKKAILQVADTGPLESLVVMLNSVGYSCFLPEERLRARLRAIGCDTVLDIKGLIDNWGYEKPFPLPEASVDDMKLCDLYVDVKGHRNGPLIWKEWPNLEHKTLWYRINGSKPEHVIRADGFDCGDEVNPPCPVITPNQWYKYAPSTNNEGKLEYSAHSNTHKIDTGHWGGRSYAFWPPFVQFMEYSSHRVDPSARYTTANRDNGSKYSKYEHPICLIHNLAGWGYGALVEPFHALGIKMHGTRSPDGLLQHKEIPVRLSKALAMVHLKSNDAPGYALYEALAAACPIICTRRLIWRCKMQDLLIPDETCLVFDRETHDTLSQQDVLDCTKEVSEHLQKLSDPSFNRIIGEAGRARLKEVMWNQCNTQDVDSLRQFMIRNFGA